MRVSGCRPTGTPCILQDYRRLQVSGEDYPGIIPAPDNEVEGLLYSDIPQSAWNSLDRFEGDIYSRRPVEVELRAGGREKAYAYVVRPEFVHRLAQRAWDLDEFLAGGRKRFEKSYREFLNPEEANSQRGKNA